MMRALLPAVAVFAAWVSGAATLRDGSWLYGHDSGDHDGLGDNPMNCYNVPLSAPISIGDAARAFGLKNVCVCRWGHADDAYLRQFEGLGRVSWAITGERDDRYYSLLSHDFKLLGKMPNLVAFDLDDYFRPQGSRPDDVVETPDGAVKSAAGAIPYDELIRLRDRAHADPKRPVALQLVVYDFELRAEMRPVFDAVDRVQYWTWCGKDLGGLRERFAYYRTLAPGKPTTLGIYMWDFGNRKPLELGFMKQQLAVGYELWKCGEVEGFVFHCSNLLNKDLPAVEYARAWFAAHADETRETAVTHPVPDPVVSPSADERMTFSGTGERQLLCSGDGRVTIVEPSGRVPWKRVGCGTVSCVGLRDGSVYWSGAEGLRRVRYALPCDPHAAAETLVEDEVRGFDFVERDGRLGADLVFLRGNTAVVIKPETMAETARVALPPGAQALRASGKGRFTVVAGTEIFLFGTDGVRADVRKVSGSSVNDAVLLADGNLLVARDAEIVEYCACGNARWRFARPADAAFAAARFTSVQRIAGQTVVGVTGNGRDPAGKRPTAFGVSAEGRILWSCSSSTDRDMRKVIRIQSEEEYN